VIDRIKAWIESLRAHHPHVDRLVRMQEHFGSVKAGQQAGAVTYFGFLSVFPVLAIAYFVVGLVARVYPHAQQNLHDAIDSVLPGLVGGGQGQVSLANIQSSANTVGVVGLVGVLYAGLGWLSSLRSALLVVFCVPSREQPNFLVGKLRDLATLVVLGVVLLLTVAVTGVVDGFSTQVLHWIGAPQSLNWLVKVISIAFGLAANMLLFFAMFVLLAEPRLPHRNLWAGAALGGVGFEILKQISGVLLKSTQGQPAFQVFGISLILLVWINYFSRVTLYAAAYAFAIQPEPGTEAAPVQGPSTPPLAIGNGTAAAPRVGAVPAFLAGAVSSVVGLALLRARRR